MAGDAGPGDRGDTPGSPRRCGDAVRWRARLAYVAAALVLVAGGTLAASPEARSTVLRWLGLKSVEIRREPLRPGVGRELDLGPPIALPRGTRVPSALGTPDAVYDTTLPDGTHAVSLVYAGPPMVLVQTFRARGDAVHREDRRIRRRCRAAHDRRRARLLDHRRARLRVPVGERASATRTSGSPTASCSSSATGCCSGRGRDQPRARRRDRARQLSDGSGGIVASSA